MSRVPVSTIEMSTNMRKKRADQRSSITILVLGDGRSFFFFHFVLCVCARVGTIIMMMRTQGGLVLGGALRRIELFDLQC